MGTWGRQQFVNIYKPERQPSPGIKVVSEGEPNLKTIKGTIQAAREIKTLT